LLQDLCTVTAVEFVRHPERPFGLTRIQQARDGRVGVGRPDHPGFTESEGVIPVDVLEFPVHRAARKMLLTPR